MADWLSDFVEHSSIGEASPRLLYWVGVSTVAACLRRRVWFDMEVGKWSPNFYILIVGEPGFVKKSTSIDFGTNFTYRVPQIHHGPDTVTWQALVEYVAGIREDFMLDDGTDMEMSAVTLAISEFGKFFDPTNRDLVDTLTDLWDGKSSTKMTKGNGTDEMINPWINLISACTPHWMAQHFNEALVGGGLASRFIFLYGEEPSAPVAWPKRAAANRSGGLAQRKINEAALLDRLRSIANYVGEYELSEDAYQWGEHWYNGLFESMRQQASGSLLKNFMARQQGHLIKLAMVISAARAEFPIITLRTIQEANDRLNGLEGDNSQVLGRVGQSRVTSAAREIVDAVNKAGSVEKRLLYQRQFFSRLSIGEYNEAIQSAIQAELILEVSDVAKPLLMPR